VILWSFVVPPERLIDHAIMHTSQTCSLHNTAKTSSQL